MKPFMVFIRQIILLSIMTIYMHQGPILQLQQKRLLGVKLLLLVATLISYKLGMSFLTTAK